MKEISRRLCRLENFLALSAEPKTLESMFEAFERGDYGQLTAMSVVASILSRGGSGEHLRGGRIPDLLLDYFAERLKKSMDNGEGVSGRSPEKNESGW